MLYKIKLYTLIFLICSICIPAFSQGWTKLTTTGAITARSNASAIYVPAKNKMYVFGGETSTGNVNELWSLDLNNNKWSLVPNKATKVPAARYTQLAMYDTIMDRMLMWSGQGAALYNDVWAFNFNDSTWQELFADGNVSGAPLKRYGTATAFDPIRRNLINFAGFTTSGRFDDTWSFNLDTLKWSNKTNTYFPLKRCLTSTSFAADRRLMIVYGGQSTGNLDDIWTLNTDTYIWTNPSPATKPTARHYPSNVYCGNGYAVVFGGSYLSQGNTAGGMNDLWSFSLDTQKWDSLPQGSTKPAARYGHTAIYIPAKDKMIIFGGTSGSLLADTWEYSGVLATLTTVNNISTAKSFLSVYPNPCVGDAKLSFYLHERSTVEITIYDIKGSIVASPVSTQLNEGEHTVDLSPYQLTPGIYIGCLKNSKGIQSIKLVVGTK